MEVAGKRRNYGGWDKFAREFLILHRNFTWKILDPCCVAHTHTHTFTLGSVARRRLAKDISSRAGEKLAPNKMASSLRRRRWRLWRERETEHTACWDRRVEGRRIFWRKKRSLERRKTTWIGSSSGIHSYNSILTSVFFWREISLWRVSRKGFFSFFIVIKIFIAYTTLINQVTS